MEKWRLPFYVSCPEKSSFWRKKKEIQMRISGLKVDIVTQILINTFQIQGGYMRVKVNGNDYDIKIIGQNVIVNGKQITAKFDEDQITIEGKKFYLDYIEDSDPSLVIVNGMAYIVSKNSDLTISMKELRAPISGRIIEVMVKAGDDIIKGQQIVVLEAMKMQNHIYSPTTAKISELRVKEGQTVKTGEILATFQ
ncbi:MAG: acetyl-CoA carboxylase biotin carboxyl carrier protein subunit [Nitrosopumilales archaeon]|nr:MAG: acetyl-CoA carboxylase biotin carboxyl carrier protein subunit [Nitrosopumilales archaeon]